MGDDQRLGWGDPNLSPPIPLCKFRDLLEIARLDPAHRDFKPNVIEARLLLSENPSMVGDRRLTYIHACWQKSPTKPSFHLLAEPRLSPIIQEKCESGCVTRVAIAEVSVDEGNGAEHVYCFLGRYEDV